MKFKLIEVLAAIAIVAMVLAIVTLDGGAVVNLRDCSELYLIDSREAVASNSDGGYIHSNSWYTYECDGRVVESRQDPNTLNVKVKR